MVKKAFVLMPFSEDLKEVYEYLINISLSSAGYEVKRADDIRSQRNILNDIIEGIITSDLILADLTGSNPNVYYELGIAHALNKHVILLTQNIEELPFDLRSYRVIPYSTYFASMEIAKAELSALAKDAYDNKLPFGNPVKDSDKSFLNQLEPASSLNSSSTVLNYDDKGLLDYSVQLEDGLIKLTEIVLRVGAKLSDSFTPQVESSTSKIISSQNSSKDQLIIIRSLADHIQDFAAFIRPENDQYRLILKDVESSIEFLLSYDSGMVRTKENGLQDLIDVWVPLQDQLTQGRDSTFSLIESMDNLPNLEINFNRARKFMLSQLRDFVDNIDQTISIISRGTRLALSLKKRFEDSRDN
ncbi:MAG TPA: hypothetical protein VGJ90_06265 [Methylophilaceae bacterium]|jgi:hypothetical protein